MGSMTGSVELVGREGGIGLSCRDVDLALSTKRTFGCFRLGRGGFGGR
jgi:hypothetical protein